MRDKHGLCPPDVVEFIISLLDYNDNVDNKVFRSRLSAS